MVRLLEITGLQALGIFVGICVGIFSAFSAWLGRILLDKTEKIIMKQKIEVLEKAVEELKEYHKEIERISEDVAILKDARKNK